MIKRYLLSGFVLCLSAIISFGQPNSVLLKNNSGVTISKYNSIQAAYNAIPVTLTQAYTIAIDTGYTGASEIYPVTFTARTGASATNTITLTVADTTVRKAITSVGDTSDAFVLDNASWVIFDGLQQQGLVFYSFAAGPLTHNTISLINGASHNVVRNCAFINLLDLGTGSSIFFGGTNGLSGNSFNTVQNCFFLSPVNITSIGSSAYPNNMLLVKNNTLSATLYGVHTEDGTGTLFIDSNQVQINHDSARSYGILLNRFKDTAVITRNIIKWSNRYNYYNYTVTDSIVKGIEIHASNPYLPVFALINNNTIGQASLTIIGNNNGGYDLDSSLSIYTTGLELSGSTMSAQVYFNTIWLDGKLTGNVSQGKLASSALLVSDTSNLSYYEIKNNILINNRTGGNSGAQHTALAFTGNTGTLDIDYNTYYSTTNQLAKIGSTVYNTFAGYQAAIPGGGNEVHSDTFNVQFATFGDPHLAASMGGDSRLRGQLIPQVSYDFENDVRSFPYRGADEYMVACNNLTKPDIYTPSDSICQGQNALLQSGDIYSKDGVIHIWQSRIAGSGSNFTDIKSNAGSRMLTTILTTITQPTEFRLLDSCVAGGAVAVSDTVLLNIYSKPTVSSISVSHTGTIYTFTANLVKNATSNSIWDFGDGTTLNFSSPVQTHYYSMPGTYTVRFIARNGNCPGIGDTATATIQVILGIGNVPVVNNFKILPNPSMGLFTLTTDAYQQGDLLIISNLLGRQIYMAPITAQEMNIDLSNQPAGIYLLQLKSAGSNHVSKIVIER